MALSVSEELGVSRCRVTPSSSLTPRFVTL